MPEIVDVSFACDRYAKDLKRAGVRTVIRYYTRDSPPNSAKRLGQAEARALASAGLRLCIVYEGRHGDQIENFDGPTGFKDGIYARIYAHHTINQPEGSAIYFGVDTDASKAEIRDRIIPYFKGVAEAFSGSKGEPSYTIGVYGSGAVCQALLDAGLVKLTWLAQSTGWTNYKTFLESGRWTMLQKMSATVGGIDCDPDIAGDGKDVGDFALDMPAKTSIPLAPARMVNARSGLHLRSGPGVEFDTLRLLPYGTSVYPLTTSGSWMLVDLQGDGAADGYVSAGFLSGTNELVPSGTTAAMPAFAPKSALLSGAVRMSDHLHEERGDGQSESDPAGEKT